MRVETSLILLLLAAVLEVAGDALIRSGLHADSLRRIAFFAAGAVVLFSYGVFVNTPSWDFGRLLGIYIVLFFIVSQTIAWIVFHETPGIRLLAGGALIICGGLVISWDTIAKP